MLDGQTHDPFASLYCRVGILDEMLSVLGVPVDVIEFQPKFQRNLLVSPNEFDLLSQLERAYPNSSVAPTTLYRSLEPHKEASEQYMTSVIAESVARFNTAFKGTPLMIVQDADGNYQLDVTNPVLRLQMQYKNQPELAHG